MKKQFLKKHIHSAAVLSLCAGMLMGVPVGPSAPSGNGSDGKPGIVEEIPDKGDGREPGGEPGISPLNDLPPRINKED